jgi:V/A-type H+/Na+-transporting ATPase subunit C
MVRLSEDSKYGFAIGRVRALEPALIDRIRYERLMHARSADDFAAGLAETAYGRFLENGVAGVSQALDTASKDNTDFFSAYALDEWLLRLFSLPAAVRDLKTAIKSTLSQGKMDVSIPRELDSMPQRPLVVSAIAETVEAFAQKREPAAVDVVLDRLLQQIELLVSISSEFMTGYFGLHADVENLRTLVRLKAKASADGDLAGEMRAAFLPGGSLTLASMSAALPQPWPAVVELLAKAPPFGAGSEVFREYIERGQEAVSDRRSFTRMERLGREAELRFLRQTRYATFGHEPLVAFFLMRENELRNLRLLFAAKLAGLAEDEMQDLVAYVE